MTDAQRRKLLAQTLKSLENIKKTVKRMQDAESPKSRK